MRSMTDRTRRASVTAMAMAVVAPAAFGVTNQSRLRAQAPQAPANGPAFEVASIKPNNSGDGTVMLQQQPGGRFTATNIPLRLLIRNAYQLQDFQIVGGPSWIGSERYNIVAKAEDGGRRVRPCSASPERMVRLGLSNPSSLRCNPHPSLHAKGDDTGTHIWYGEMGKRHQRYNSLEDSLR